MRSRNIAGPRPVHGFAAAAGPASTIHSNEGWRRPTVLVAIGLAGFMVGLLVYWMDRDTSRVALIPTVPWLAHRHAFGVLGGWLPSLVHTFAFGLFTAAVLPERAAPRYGACVAWFVVNAVFEIGQHPQISAPLAGLLRGDLGGLPLTHALANYFVHGTFDLGDIVAALLGAAAAGVVLRTLHPRQRKKHE